MKNFFKKPLNLASFLLAVLGLIGIIVMLAVPHGAKYTMKDTLNDKEITSCLELKDGKIYASSKIDGKWTDEVAMGEYEISKGKLSYKTVLGNVPMGKVNAFRIQLEDVEEGKLTCQMTVIFFVVACAMTVAGVAGIAYGALSKKKKKK